MKKSLSKVILIALLLAILSVQSGFSVPADPNFEFTITQPNGEVISLKPVGDERNGRYITLDGYTVTKQTDGWYYYAQLDSQGQLTASEYKVTTEKNRTAELISFLQTIPQSLSAENRFRVYPDPKMQPELLKNSALQKAIEANNNVLVILIQYYDYPAIKDSAQFDALMNEPGYDIYGSANDFYQECSYGQFGITSDVTPWYTADSDYLFYAYNDGNNWVAAAQLAREAIVWASVARDIDFSKYDNDGDGEVEGLFIVHAGPGAETGASDFPWSHKWWLSAAGLAPVVTDGVTIDAYTMEPELHSGTEIARIGVFVHEFGHALGLPDLYGTYGIGSWGVMSGGSWGGGGKCPVHFSAWSKAQLGWTNPINILADTTDVLLPDASTSPVSYRLWNEGTVGPEYFLVEYRGKTNFDQFLPGCGVAIWHIDETVTGAWTETHRRVDLEEANNIENNSAANVWIDKTFGIITAPNSNTNDGDSTNVQIAVTSIACDAAGMTADFAVGLPPGCCLTMRGNVDNDLNDEITIADIVYFVEYSFAVPKGPDPVCFEEADVDASNDLTIADLVYLVEYSFASPAGPAPLICP
ncbi:MAG: M6 family metalloprotease domain-containing protein [Calditrichaeota bacterium]|nr:MAG: M6 family metalloprotease domain-containing protein [Calditrichota bacterium]